MILLDEVIGYDDCSLIAGVTIAEASAFIRPKGVPGYVGLEYMAQACGAFAGIHALASGERIKIGLLLGSRDYRVSVPWFNRGQHLRITATIAFRDDPMSAFNCTIAIDDKLVAEARLNVYQADEIS
jgi:predicted hotdog family 3-hydroxylacyl-ACP dehydratase